MKQALPWTLVVLLALLLLARRRPEEDEPREVVRTEWRTLTRVKTDTLLLSPPMAVFLRFTTDTLHIGDTVVQRRQAVYRDTLYEAYVSGYSPRLDSIRLFPRTVTRTVTIDRHLAPKPKRWGFGLQAGYSHPHGPYVGIGLSYNLWSW